MRLRGVTIIPVISTSAEDEHQCENDSSDCQQNHADLRMEYQPGYGSGQDVKRNRDEEGCQEDGEANDAGDDAADERDVAEQVDDGREEEVNSEDHASKGQDTDHTSKAL